MVKGVWKVTWKETKDQAILSSRTFNPQHFLKKGEEKANVPDAKESQNLEKLLRSDSEEDADSHESSSDQEKATYEEAVSAALVAAISFRESQEKKYPEVYESKRDEEDDEDEGGFTGIKWNQMCLGFEATGTAIHEEFGKVRVRKIFTVKRYEKAFTALWMARAHRDGWDLKVRGKVPANTFVVNEKMGKVIFKALGAEMNLKAGKRYGVEGSGENNISELGDRYLARVQNHETQRRDCKHILFKNYKSKEKALDAAKVWRDEMLAKRDPNRLWKTNTSGVSNIKWSKRDEVWKALV